MVRIDGNEHHVGGIEIIDLAVAIGVVDSPDRGSRPDVDLVGVLHGVEAPRPLFYSVEFADGRVILARRDARTVRRVLSIFALGRKVEALASVRGLGQADHAVGHASIRNTSITPLVIS